MELPNSQRVNVDAWLFEKGFTYEEVVGECLRQFGLQVSKSSVGRYYERVIADRFAKIQREKRMALEPELSPSEAYEVLLRRIAVLAWEEMDQPLEDINHKVVVRLVRVLLAARREKHMETRVWVERRKAENWLARECLRHWRREMKKKAHVSYLPILMEGKGNGGKQSSMSPPLSGSLAAQSLRGERDGRLGSSSARGRGFSISKGEDEGKVCHKLTFVATRSEVRDGLRRGPGSADQMNTDGGQWGAQVGNIGVRRAQERRGRKGRFGQKTGEKAS